jgi:hypothetical protein
MHDANPADERAPSPGSKPRLGWCATDVSSSRRVEPENIMNNLWLWTQGRGSWGQ